MLAKRILQAALLGIMLGLISGCISERGGGLVAVIRTDPDPPRGEYPLTVTFDGTGSAGDIQQYLWSFGDGSGGEEGAVVSHTYAEPGRYTAYLTVRDPRGAEAQAWVTVDVRSKRPEAAFRIDPPIAKVGHPVRFYAEADDPDGEVVAYHWDFGDGEMETTSEPYATHVYGEPDYYTVTLVVEDDFGDLSDPVRNMVTIYEGCPACP